MASLTVYFEGQYWVGVIEWQDDGRLYAANHIFGPQPSNEEVLLFVQHEYAQIERHAGGVAAEQRQPERRPNPKRMLREAARQLQADGISAEAEAALRDSREQRKREREQAARDERQRGRDERWEKAQAKAYAKRRGH